MIKRLGRLMALIIIIFLIVASLFVSPKPIVRADSTIYHSLSAYQAVATAQVSGLSDRTKISFNSERLVLQLKKQFPEISKVSVELPLFSSRPAVRLYISQPAFILVTGSNRFVLNKQGVAVSAPAISTPKSGLMTIEDQSHFNLSSGSQALSSDQLGFVSQVVAQCKIAHVAISTLVLPAAAQELDIHPTGVNYYVKFYLGGDALTEAGQYLAARHHFQQTNIQPSQYVDVRVAGKIFYK